MKLIDTSIMNKASFLYNNSQRRKKLEWKTVFSAQKLFW